MSVTAALFGAVLDTAKVTSAFHPPAAAEASKGAEKPKGIAFGAASPQGGSSASHLFKKVERAKPPKLSQTEALSNRQAALLRKKTTTSNKDSKGKRTKLSHLNKKTFTEEDRRTVFVGNLPNTIKARALIQHFKDCGEIVSARIRNIRLEKPTDGKDRGRAVRVLRGEIKMDDSACANGFVVFESEGAIRPALEKTGTVLQGRHITVTREDAQSKAFDPRTSVFLGNLAYDLSDEDVWAFFNAGGITDVSRVRIIRDRETGAGKGFGYVSFASANSANQAIGLRGQHIRGREIRICHVQKPKQTAANPYAALEPTRREKRALERTAAKKTAKTTGKKKDGDSTEPDAAAADTPAWMGMVTNPRKKLHRDLRPLTISAVDLKKKKKKAQQEAGAGKARVSKKPSAGKAPRKQS